MDIKVSPDVLEDIKAALKAKNKSAVRFELAGGGCGGCGAEDCGGGFSVYIVLDKPYNGDYVTQVDGVNFVIDDPFQYFIDEIEVIKVNDTFAVKCGGSCC
jgi:uncharacterized protein YneR